MLFDDQADETTIPAPHEAPGQQSITEPQPVEINYKELYLRVNADIQNFKKRVERERSELADTIRVDVIERIIPIVDDLERAISTAQTGDQQPHAWLEGFNLILKNFKKKLTDLGVEPVATEGIFNPELHEALMHVTDSGLPTGSIVQVLEKGYVLRGKVIKYARVSVAQ